VSDFGGQQCKLKCPKCRKQNLFLSEVWDGNGIWFTVKDGVMPDEADDHFQGAPVYVRALCTDCRHEWRVRGASEVADLAVEISERESCD